MRFGKAVTLDAEVSSDRWFVRVGVLALAAHWNDEDACGWPCATQRALAGFMLSLGRRWEL